MFVTIPLLVILEKYCFISFFRIETHLLRCLLCSFSLTSEGFLLNLFFSQLLVKIAFLRSFEPGFHSLFSFSVGHASPLLKKRCLLKLSKFRG